MDGKHVLLMDVDLNKLAVIAHSKGFTDSPVLWQALLDLRETERKIQSL